MPRLSGATGEENRHMHIGFSSFVLQGGKSGVASYVTNFLSALQEEDRENTYDILIPADEKHLVPLHNPNFRMREIPRSLSNPVPNIFWHNLALPAICQQEKYDLVHVPSYRRLPWIKGVPVVATVHDLATFHVAGKYDSARMFYNHRVVPSLIRRADRVVTVSHFTREDVINLVGYPPERISVVYPGLNHAVYRPVPREECGPRLSQRFRLEKPYVVFVSRLEHPAKNHVRLIEAFERLKARKRSDLQLVLAGADWNGAEHVKARAARSAVSADILLTGFLALEDIPVLYSGCSLMVYPSLFEGFGLPLIEALACGAPVICSNTSSMREIAGDRFATFDPENPDEIASCMEEALERGRTPERKAADLAFAAGFQWSETAKRMMEVYAQTKGIAK
jgi:glycosyltransferase involved in cell wall biosynthesis